MADRYEPSSFEQKWRKRWDDADLFRTREEPGREKFYGMDFFPYPSGAGLSVGHCRNFVPTDVICRMKFMQGHNVLHPMGFDAFGLPAENEAIKRRSHPEPMIEQYAANYRRQMDLIGISYDWSRSFASSDPTYYKWTQWIFELLFRRGLAYRKLAAVNWDPVDKTVLADEEVVAGRAERSGALVEKKWIPQWFFKITEYADRLIDDLDGLDWPEGIKTQQRNWIGRSEGVQFSMPVVALTDDAYARIISGEPQPAAKQSEPRHSELEAIEAELRSTGFEPAADAAKAEKARLLHESLNRSSDQISSSSVQDGIEKAVERMQAKMPELEIVRTERRPSFEVFTTRIDTVFGMTFCVLAPEHPVVDRIASMVDPAHAEAIHAYQTVAKAVSDADRQAAQREKTGVFTGAYAINPVNDQPVPIWIADYVLATYGTGAIMAVPAHDQRDFDFAVKYGLDVRPVIKPDGPYLAGASPLGADEALDAYLKDPKSFNPVFESKSSTLINSGRYTGDTVSDAQRRLAEWMESRGIGERKVQYKLRDWLISRQRYWGCPIPVIHAADGEIQLVPEECLPVELPRVEHYEPTGDGTSPLAHIPEYVNTTDLDGRLGKRETDTMGGFACSSWYFLRFTDPHDADHAWTKALADAWMPVDCYVGGAEHAVMHLLYARFWTKVFYDAGLVSVKEPFKRLENQGQVLGYTPYRKVREGEKLDVGEDGVLVSFEQAAKLPPSEVTWRWARMSKSKGNVVTPDEMVEQYGADALRLYLLFKAPFNADINWENKGVEDLSKFLNRVFRFVAAVQPNFAAEWRDLIGFEELGAEERAVRRATHQTIRDVTADIERFSFNTYVAWLMKYLNALNDALGKTGAAPTRASALVMSEAVETLVLLLAPGAPFSADELWESIGKQGLTMHQEWPQFDAALASEDEITVAIQVNGKLRDTLRMDASADRDTLESAAKGSAKVQTHLEGKTIVKVIVVPGKLVNIVAK